MRGFFITQKNNQIYRRLTSAIAFVLTFSLIFSPVASYAQAINFLNLPIPGTLLAPSPGFTPAIVRGITIHPDNPLMFDFIVDKGDTKLAGEELEEESIKL
ncbi:MAG: hypothetical protein KAR31_11250, partial [Candidatus Omnitrophica bacterium]|nr:hypothetical protein [Candidatus Omnitrophota bacterium]